MQRKLIYDIGLHKGEDTEYYLARGYRVIAVEANRELVEYCQAKFKTELESGDLKIFFGAIVEDDTISTTAFYKNSRNSVWGTVSKRWAERNRRLGAPSTEVRVPALNFLELVSEFGCPYYLKVDIEGMDLVCLKKLCAIDARPRFISIESEKSDFELLLEEFAILTQLGYKKFFVKQQANIDSDSVPFESTEGTYVNYKFSKGSTGLFGTDLGSQWLSKSEAIEVYKKIYREYRLFGDGSILRKHPLGRRAIKAMSQIVGRPIPGWYDTHAAWV